MPVDDIHATAASARQASRIEREWRAYTAAGQLKLIDAAGNLKAASVLSGHASRASADGTGHRVDVAYSNAQAEAGVDEVDDLTSVGDREPPIGLPALHWNGLTARRDGGRESTAVPGRAAAVTGTDELSAVTSMVGLVMVDPFSAAGMLGATVAQTVASQTTTRGLDLPRGRKVAQAARSAAYDDLASAAMRARIRLSSLMAVHHSQFNVLHFAAQVAGYPIVVTQLERLGQDLCLVTDRWRPVRRLGSQHGVEAADELVLSLLQFCSLVEPGWWRPRRRAEHGVALVGAESRWVRANRTFELVGAVDAATSRRTRRDAQAHLAAHIESVKQAGRSDPAEPSTVC